MKNDEKSNKVLIIGLDGGTWKVLKPMMDNGIMPNLEKLVNEGASGILKSTIPPVTAPAWTSFQTGVNPGKHGIFDFQTFNPQTRQSTIVNAKSIPLKTIWDIASEAGKKVITINVPLTYPPKEDENRITIGCMLSPKEDPSLIYPKELFDTCIKNIGYEITGGPLERRTSMKLETFIQKHIQVETKRFEVAMHLMNEFPWDLFMLHIQSSDGIQHCFYPYLDPLCPDFDGQKHKVISKFYRTVDDHIGRLLELIDENVTVIIVSDHGFRPLRKYINLNTWLRNEGWLSISSLSMLARFIEAVRKYDVLRLRKRISGLFLKSFFGLRKMATRANNQSIDWNRTKAFMPNGIIFGAVFINDKVESELLRKEITEGLYELTDVETGEKPIKQIYCKEEIYSGPYMHLLPDLIVELAPGYSVGIPLVATKKVIRRVKYPYDLVGTHDLNGIIVVSGVGVKAGTEIKANIIDIPPTILALLGVGVPEYMDGCVLKEPFGDDLNVRIGKASHLLRPGQTGKMTLEDQEEVRKRLSDLGYL